jgi:hypothetical protein
MVINRNLENITDNFHEFWWIIIFSRDIPERMKRGLNCQKGHETLPRQNMHQKTLEDTRRHGTKAKDWQLLGGAGRPHPSAT